MSIFSGDRKNIVRWFCNILKEGGTLVLPPGVKEGVKLALIVDHHTGKEYGISLEKYVHKGVLKLWEVISGEEQHEFLRLVKDISADDLDEIKREELDGSPELASSFKVEDFRKIFQIYGAVAQGSREELLRHINDALEKHGQSPIEPIHLTAKQRAVGRLLSFSMMQGGQRPRGLATAPARLPRFVGYRILRHLGGGGEGDVYEAVHEKTGETVAIKYSDAPVDLPIDEAHMKILQGLAHPNLVRYRRHGVVEDKKNPGVKHPWILMDFVGDNNLAQMMEAAANRLDQDRVLIVAEEVLEGLAYLHANGIIHRDLKPDNVMIDGSFQIRLIDFGLAKKTRIDGKSTMGPAKAGVFVGTAAYASLEQHLGKKATLASDVWAFGAILYELLVGSPLFPEPNQSAIAIKMATEKLSFDNERIPIEIRPILQRCLEKVASDRWPDAQRVLQEFRLAVEKLRLRKRHEFYRAMWFEIFNKKLLEAFVLEHRGPFNEFTVPRFVEFAACHGVSGVDEEGLAKVLPPMLAAQRAAEALAEEINRAVTRLATETVRMTTSERDKANKDIGALEKRYAEAKEGVLAQVYRALPNATREWEEIQAEHILAEKQAKNRANAQRAKLRARSEAYRKATRELLMRISKPASLVGAIAALLMSCGLCCWLSFYWTPGGVPEQDQMRKQMVGTWRDQTGQVWTFGGTGDFILFDGVADGKSRPVGTWEVPSSGTLVVRLSNQETRYTVKQQNADMVTLSQEGWFPFRRKLARVVKVDAQSNDTKNREIEAAAKEKTDQALEKKLKPLREKAELAHRNGIGYFGPGRYDKAAQCFAESEKANQEMLALDPKNDWYQRAIRSDQYHGHKSKGMKFLEEGLWTASQNEFEAALRLNSGDKKFVSGDNVEELIQKAKNKTK